MHKGQSREGIVEDYKPDNPKELQTQMLVEVRLVIYWAGFNTQELVRPVASKKVYDQWKAKVTHSCPTLCDPMDYMEFSRPEY